MQLKDKIKNLALENQVPAQAILQNLMLERLLERISISKYKDRIIQKNILNEEDCHVKLCTSRNTSRYPVGS
jgi:hypothetical protein